MYVREPIVFEDDPVFALGREAAARIASGLPCINATVGVLVDDAGQLMILPTVAEVLRQARPQEWVPYAATTGAFGFCDAVLDEVLQNRPELREHALAFATPGATGAIGGALKIFLGRGESALTSSFCWSAYHIIARAADRGMVAFDMFESDHARFHVEAFERRLDELLGRQGRAVVLLNDPCHNPTGYSMSTGDWRDVADVLRRHCARGPITVILDAVYAAFSSTGVNTALHALEPLADDILIAIAWSASKSFTSYGLRVGALVAIASGRVTRTRIRDSIALHCCGTWANCNHGAMLAVTRMLREPALLGAVERERREVIGLLDARARLFAQAKNKLVQPAYSGGFFTSVFVDNAAQVAARLRTDGVYVVPLDGALRVALSSVKSSDVARMVATLEAQSFYDSSEIGSQLVNAHGL